jgi:hypothetical protein
MITKRKQQSTKYPVLGQNQPTKLFVRKSNGEKPPGEGHIKETVEIAGYFLA